MNGAIALMLNTAMKLCMPRPRSQPKDDSRYGRPIPIQYGRVPIEPLQPYRTQEEERQLRRDRIRRDMAAMGMTPADYGHQELIEMGYMERPFCRPNSSPKTKRQSAARPYFPSLR